MPRPVWYDLTRSAGLCPEWAFVGVQVTRLERAQPRLQGVTVGIFRARNFIM